MLRELDKYYSEKPEPNRSCLLALRAMILAIDTEVTETQKWGMPCFCYKKKMFAYLWIDKKSNEPYILFVEGKLLDHPLLETGSRARMKIFRVDPNQDLPADTINMLLQEAIDLYKKGIISTK